MGNALKSNNTELIINDEVDEVIKELFDLVISIMFIYYNTNVIK